MSTDRIGFINVESGFIAARTTIGWPLSYRLRIRRHCCWRG